MPHSIRNIPIFPLGMVGFPDVQVPLTIFEARYRVLFSTLLAGGHDIDEDLVQKESEFLGSKEFGTVWQTDRNSIAEVGTLLKIQAHHTVKDGRLIVQTTGTRRFRLLKILQYQPVLLARCEMIDDSDGDAESPEAEAAKEATVVAFQGLNHLITRLQREGSPSPIAISEEDIQQMSPSTFSYKVANMFGQANFQYEILKEDSTVKRLNVLQTTLEGQNKYLQAVVALKDVGSTSDAKPDVAPPGSKKDDVSDSRESDR